MATATDGEVEGHDDVPSTGPGLVSGTADTDPTTVGTMVVVGATTGYALSLLVWLVLPALAVVQAVSARVGTVAGGNLQTCVRSRFGWRSQALLLLSLLPVSVVTAAADLQAGATALGLLVHVDARWLVLPLAAVVSALLVFGAYDEVQRVLQWLALLLLAFPVAAVLARPDWGQILRATVLPRFELSGPYVGGSLAIVGTTLTSYVYVWQTIASSEQRSSLRRLRSQQAGTTAGIAVAVALFWFILVASAAAFGGRGEPVRTAQDAARALEPAAGPAAAYVFGAALLVSALVALPVILATCAYAVAEEFDWERGLSHRLRAAPRFYATVAVAVVLAAGSTFLGVAPLQLLFVASVLGGLATPVGLVYLMLVASSRRVMGPHRSSLPLLAAGWVVTLAVSAAALTGVVLQL
ncbi:MAG: NRAMP family divalent metal transporter [Actinomycetota bacterium]